CNVSVVPFLLSALPRLPASPLFPYTTLFRSGLERTPARFSSGQRRMIIRHGRHQLQPYLGTFLNRLGGKRGRRQVSIERIRVVRSEEHTSELQSRENLVCRLLLEKKKNVNNK